MQLLATKLFIPSTRPELVSRPRLVERLHEGVYRKLSFVSAPAGFGKATLAGEWVATAGRPVVWLSLDEGDRDPARFFARLTAALQQIDPAIGHSAQAMLQTPQPPPPEPLLTALINDIAGVTKPFVLVLDDYHLVTALPVHQQLGLLLDHLPPQMHLVIVFVWACRRKLRDVGLHSRHLGLSLLSGILITVIGPVVSYTAEFVVQLPKQPVLHWVGGHAAAVVQTANPVWPVLSFRCDAVLFQQDQHL